MMITKFSWTKKPLSDQNNFQIGPFIDCELGIRVDRDELQMISGLVHMTTHTNGACSITIRNADRFRRNLLMILEADGDSSVQDRIDKMVCYNVLMGTDGDSK